MSWQGVESIFVPRIIISFPLIGTLLGAWFMFDNILLSLHSLTEVSAWDAGFSDTGTSS